MIDDGLYSQAIQAECGTSPNLTRKSTKEKITQALSTLPFWGRRKVLRFSIHSPTIRIKERLSSYDNLFFVISIFFTISIHFFIIWNRKKSDKQNSREITLYYFLVETNGLKFLFCEKNKNKMDLREKTSGPIKVHTTQQKQWKFYPWNIYLRNLHMST